VKIHRRNIRRGRQNPSPYFTKNAVPIAEVLETRRLLSGTIPTVPTPAAHWAFDEGTGTTAADSSGNGHNGTLGTGVTWATGNVGTHAIKMTGTSTGVVTATGPVVNTSGSFTASAWVDLASLSGYQTILSIAGNNVAGFFLQFRGDTGTFAFTRLASDSTSAAAAYSSDPSAPVTGTWYHIVGVDDASAGTLTLYVDGQSQGSVAFTGGWAANGNTLIGHGFYGGAQVDYVNGSIDDAELFASALSAAQVAALDQPAAYPFDEGTGTTAADYSGHGNTLTLGGGASWGPGKVGANSLAVNGTAAGNATYASPVINTAQPFSVSAWVNLTSLSGYQTFVSIDGNTTSGFYLQLSGATGKFAFSRLASDSDSAASYSAAAAAAPTAGTWYNLVGVNDVATSQIILYVNGVLQSTVTYTGGWQATGETVIGGGKFNGARTDFVNGDIDDVHFYDSPLSAGAAGYVGTGGISTVNIATGTTGVTVSPDLFGAFMEDINYGGEGGIYNDEVRNSGFNDSTNNLNAWATVASSGVTASLASDATTGPTSALTESGKLTITSGVSATARAGISNAGYFGVAVAPSTSYSVEFYAKATAGFTGPLTVDLESTTGTIYATATVSAITTSWAKYTATLNTGTNTPTTATNLFVISTTSTSANGATLWFGATYLYPPSYQGAANHLRVDLMQKLAALKPAIFRVPGGNYLEGNTYATRFEWSNTVGPIEDRPGHYNSAWGYWSTDGMGLDEYLQMAEEVGAQPILAVYAGYTLNGTSDTGQTLTNDVTDAVDEIHYVLDPVTTTWGAERAANGHPAPYNVADVEIGNEDFFSSTYATRYPLFYNAIHAAFPQLQLIATSSSTGGSPYNVIDDHFYESPQWFEANSDYFDNTPRGSTTIFIGEYASQEGTPTNDMAAALGDASWLLGLERNSDLVTMSSYAPLWANVNGYQWPTNLIGFNNTTSFGSPSYYAQVILANNHGTTVVSDSATAASGLQVLVTRTGTTYYVTVVNTLGTASMTTVNLNGVTGVSSTGTATSLIGASSTATNSITNPTNIVPVVSTVTGLGTSFSHSFPGNSITVLQFTAGTAPTVANPAAASPEPVTGTTANLSVLGADNGGESNLTYTWSSTGPAAVNFSPDGTNTAKNSVATFSQAGIYNITATILNPTDGFTTTSTVAVTVNQTLTSVAVTPATASIFDGQTSQFTAVADDQFGNALAVQPAIIWTVDSGAVGTIGSTGLYAAPASGPATDTVRAAAGSVSGTASATVILSVINGTSGNDTIRLVRSATNLAVFINNATTAAYTVAFAPLGSLTVNGNAGTDTVNIDFSGGASPVPAGGLTVDGSAGADTLIITGTSGNDTVAVNAATVTVNGSAFSYTNFESIILNGNSGGDTLTQAAQPGNAATLAFNGATSSGPSTSDTLNVNAGTYTFVAPAAGSGIHALSLAALSIGPAAQVSIATATAHTDRWLATLGSLSIAGSSNAWTGQLNLGGNDMVIHSGNLTTLTNQILTGFSNGAWTGKGIVSSIAAADTSHLTAIGIIPNGATYGSGTTLGTFDGINPATTDILLKFTYLGDANLDGAVDGSDYTKIDNGFHNHLTGWANGDFNYDNAVNGSDYTLIDNAFNTQAVSLSVIAPEMLVASQPDIKTGTAEAAPAAGRGVKPRSAFAWSTPFNSSSPVTSPTADDSIGDLLPDRIKHGTEGLFAGRNAVGAQNRY
jgi:alpha-L-arabinofuranosidase